MQACKFFKFVLVSAFVVSPLMAQSLDMPTMPSMPTMPKIGEGYYHPEMPTLKVPGKPENPKAPETKDTAVQTLSDASASDTDELLNSLFGSSNLTAKDISALYDSGMFGSLTGLSGTSASSQDLMLQQILNSLNELKTQKNNSSVEQQEAYEDQIKDSKTFKKRDPSILRFKINGYNINDSLTTVFFSETEPDGTFLLTADRKYFTSQKVRTETMYLLFRTINNNGYSTTYEVIPSIVQDSINENSFIYKMCQQKKIVAEKTGNLVVVHFSNLDFNMDLLLDIDNRAK